MVYNYLIDLKTSSTTQVEDAAVVEAFLIEIANKLGLTVLDKCSHKFTPQGLTSMLLLSESHLTIHTWPENNFACVDILTCKGQIELSLIEQLFNSSSMGISCENIQEVQRSSVHQVHSQS
ncbi:adenosylmethionine decarboxylase [Reichenbachiella versicolor]|uniref:adenosylmethionine decarboxylase n=1 Tax=Reichenbachiella versicolor TaxID=1821036 RepID=UPI000D6E661E|nr:adenosylmethionine decarboxylase [Reichenbachiella versicolor]